MLAALRTSWRTRALAYCLHLNHSCTPGTALQHAVCPCHTASGSAVNPHASSACSQAISRLMQCPSNLCMEPMHLAVMPAG